MCFNTMKHKPTAPFTLPLDAFRIPMLQGTIPVSLPAGFNNIPPNSQAIATPEVTPSCIGVQPRIDYLTYTFEAPNVGTIVREIEERLGLRFDKHTGDGTFEIGKTHWTRIQGSRGASLAHCPTSGTASRIRLNMGGEACNSVALVTLARFIDWLGTMPNGVCTRFDYNADDYNGILHLETISTALRTRQYAGYSRGEIIESVGGKRAGISVYFGGRKSLQRVVFYDKFAETEGEVDAIRHEVRCRGGRAVEMCNRIKGKNEGELWEILLGCIRASIQFGVRNGKNLDRMNPADFWIKWGELLASSPIAKIPLHRVTSIPRTISWIIRQVAKSIAKIQMFLPSLSIDEFWLRIENLGIDRLNLSDYGNISVALANFSEDELWAMFPV